MSLEKPAPRLPLVLSIEFRKNYSRKMDEGKLKNISLSGAFLAHSSTEIITNDKINICFKVSGRERILQATVIWKNNAGAGLKFHPDNNRDVQIVDDLMYFIRGRREKNRSIFDSILGEISEDESNENLS